MIAGLNEECSSAPASTILVQLDLIPIHEFTSRLMQQQMLHQVDAHFEVIRGPGRQPTCGQQDSPHHAQARPQGLLGHCRSFVLSKSLHVDILFKVSYADFIQHISPNAISVPRNQRTHIPIQTNKKTPMNTPIIGIKKSAHIESNSAIRLCVVYADTTPTLARLCQSMAMSNTVIRNN